MLLLPPLLHAAIENFYDIVIATVLPGPLGMTGAETFIITDHRALRYFCKRVSDPVMIGRMSHSLPLAAALHDYGLPFVIGPRRGAGGYFFMDGTALVALYPFVDALPSRDYQPGLLGAALAAIHGATPFLGVTLPHQGNASVYADFFKTGLPDFIDTPVQDETTRGKLRTLLVRHHAQLSRYIAVFHDLSMQTPTEYVATHGDAQGNVLLGADGTLHLIDWDEAELAPPERDLWFLSHLPGFMAGYTAVRTGFTPDPRRLVHAALKAWLEGLAIQATTILSGRGDAMTALHHLQDRRFNTERLAQMDAAIAALA